MSEEDVDEYVHFDFAIMSVFAMYVFDVSTQIGVHRQKLHSSDYWSKDEERLDDGMNGVKRASFQAIMLSLLVIVVTAIAISLPFRELDQRMVWILEGLSLLFAAVVLAMLAFDVGRWTGLYYKVWKAPEQETSHSLKELKFNVRWSYYRIFGRYYFFLMPFYQGAITILLSIIAGIGLGLAIDFIVYLVRRKEKLHRCIVIAIIVSFVLGSSVLLSDGVFFIAKVWEMQEDPQKDGCLSLLLFVSVLNQSFTWSVGVLVARSSRMKMQQRVRLHQLGIDLQWRQV